MGPLLLSLLSLVVVLVLVFLLFLLLLLHAHGALDMAPASGQGTRVDQDQGLGGFCETCVSFVLCLFAYCYYCVH